MDADCEKENNEEKDAKTLETSTNPMARLFYGKVLLEGNIHGDAFSREEAFGQWPLQVNTFVNIHESLENSLAHESLGKLQLQVYYLKQFSDTFLFNSTRWISQIYRSLLLILIKATGKFG